MGAFAGTLVLAASFAFPGQVAAQAEGAGAPDTAPAATPPRPLLAFDEDAAIAANGPALSADSVRVCGANDRRFLGELLQGSPFDFKIPYRLGDVADANAAPSAVLGRQWHISGTAGSSSIGSGDFPFDHPYGSDFNMDLVPDEPFAALSQVSGVPSDHPMHIELSAGQFPHIEGPAGPAEGMEWETNSAISRANLQTGYVPAWANGCSWPAAGSTTAATRPSRPRSTRWRSWLAPRWTTTPPWPRPSTPRTARRSSTTRTRRSPTTSTTTAASSSPRRATPSRSPPRWS